MTMLDSYPAGVPCRIDSFQPDPVAAMAFYGALLGWSFDAVGEDSDPAGPIHAAKLDGRWVATIRPAPPGLASAAWVTALASSDADGDADRAVAHGATVLLPPGPSEDGRLAVLIDPTGATIGLWQSPDRPGAELTDVPGAWAMSSLHSPSLQASAEFYSATFGWAFDQPPGSPMGLWRLPGYVRPGVSEGMPPDLVGVGVPIAPGEPTPPHWGVGLLVADINAAVAQATSLGGTVLFGPVDTPTTRSAAIADPQGGVVSLNQRR